MLRRGIPTIAFLLFSSAAMGDTIMIPITAGSLTIAGPRSNDYNLPMALTTATGGVAGTASVWDELGWVELQTVSSTIIVNGSMSFDFANLTLSVPGIVPIDAGSALSADRVSGQLNVPPIILTNGGPLTFELPFTGVLRTFDYDHPNGTLLNEYDFAGSGTVIITFRDLDPNHLNGPSSLISFDSAIFVFTPEPSTGVLCVAALVLVAAFRRAVGN